jgi:hypothetical protein
MLRRNIALVLLATMLGSCSYAYDVLAVALDGRLAFIVSPHSARRPSCVRQIEVLADDLTTTAQPEAGDDPTRVGYDTYWYESVDYNDGCANRFPLAYGTPLSGEHPQEFGKVKAKPLRREVVYDVSTTTGATGYGQDRFVIHANGHIENLPRPGRRTTTSNLVENST